MEKNNLHLSGRILSGCLCSQGCSQPVGGDDDESSQSFKLKIILVSLSSVMGLITATESAIWHNESPETETERIRLKVYAAFALAAAPILTARRGKARTTLQQNPNISVLPE